MYQTFPGHPTSYTMGAFVLVDSAGKDIELELLDHTYSSDSMYIKTKMFGPISVISSSSDTFAVTEPQIKKIHEFLSAQAKSSTAPQDANADTWTDPSTGLMWAKKDNGSNVTQAQAEDYCRNLNLAGFHDWRLPTITELKGIYDGKPGGAGPGVYSAAGSGHTKGSITLTGTMIWSSSQGNSPEDKMVFFFSMGMPMSGMATTASSHVLAVRGASK